MEGIPSGRLWGGRDFNASSAVGGYAEKDAIITMIANVVYFLIVVWLGNAIRRRKQYRCLDSTKGLADGTDILILY